MKTEKLIVILGPTASGKSALGVKLAKKFNGEIISADSRQVYRGLNLASGKISKREIESVHHFCLDVTSLKNHYTAMQWKKCAESAIRKIVKKNKIPIIIGGTAFYINALINNALIPEVKPNWKLRKELDEKTINELFRLLEKLDPRRAKTIEKDNPRRIIRAIEIVKQTGKPVPEFKPGLRDDFEVLILGVRRSKEKLKNLIAARLKKRLKLGMVNEIKKLRASGTSWKRLEELGLEPRWIARFLQNTISKPEMKSGIIRDSLKFVRHQMSWWKKDNRIRWINSQNSAEKLTKHFLN